MAKLINLIPNSVNIKEVVSVDVSDLVKKIAKNTDRNAHTEAVLELAKFLKNTKALKLLQAIETIHNIEGSIPMEVSKYRSSILKDLVDKFKSKYGPDAAKELNGAF